MSTHIVIGVVSLAFSFVFFRLARPRAIEHESGYRVTPAGFVLEPVVEAHRTDLVSIPASLIPVLSSSGARNLV